MSGVRHMLVFALDGQRLALPLEAVERVVRAVEVTPLPDAPLSVLGLINVQGRVVPVISLRRRCGLPEREIELDDQLVIARTGDGEAGGATGGGRRVALLVDRAEVIECPDGSATAAGQVLPGLHDVREVVRRDDGLVLIYDPSALLSPQERRALAGLTEAEP